MKLFKNIMQTENLVLHTICTLKLLGVLTIVILLIQRDLLGLALKIIGNIAGFYILFICLVGIIDCLRRKS